MFRPIQIDHTNCLQVAIKTLQFKSQYPRYLFKKQYIRDLFFVFYTCTVPKMPVFIPAQCPRIVFYTCTVSKIPPTRGDANLSFSIRPFCHRPNKLGHGVVTFVSWCVVDQALHRAHHQFGRSFEEGFGSGGTECLQVVVQIEGPPLPCFGISF